MPKDEFDFDDPLELNGVALYTDEDTSRDMAECFVEEFLMLGYNHKQLLAMFRNSHYLGLNMVLQNRGEPFVREVIADVFARWGRVIQWNKGESNPLTLALSPSEGERENLPLSVDRSRRREEADHAASPASPPPHVGGYQSCGHGCGFSSTTPAEQTVSLDEHLADPMGHPIPKLE